MSDLSNQLKAEDQAFSESCKRFVEIAEGLSTEIQNGLTMYIISTKRFENPTDQDFLFLNRFQIAMSLFSETESMIRNKAEGGYGMLDRSSRTTCPFRERKKIVDSFQKSIALLTEFFHTAFGDPNLKKMDSNQRRLLRMISKQESSDDRKSWMVLAGGTVLSIGLWQFGVPMTAAAVRGLWGASPRIFQIPAFIFAMKASAVSTEAAAFAYADHISSSAIPPPENKFASWDEHMSAIELFLQSPPNSPDLQSIFMSRIHANLLPMITGMPVVEMFQVVSGTTVEQQLRRLPPWIEEKFRYQPKCSRSWIGGMTDTECLIGVRSLARALLAESAPSPPEAIVVQISKDREWQGPDMSSRIATFTIPYAAYPSEIENFIKKEFAKPGYNRRLEIIERVEENKDELETLTGQSFEIDDSIDNERAANGLYKLSLLAREEPTIFNGTTEAFRLSNQFRSAYERNLRLKEDINVDASIETLRAYFRNKTNESVRWPDQPNLPEIFFAERQRLDEQKRNLLATTPIGNIECDGSGSLILDECRRALFRIARIFKMPKLKNPKIDQIIILGAEGMSTKIDFYIERRSRQSILLMRSNFSFIDFIQFSESQHWLRKPGDGV